MSCLGITKKAMLFIGCVHNIIRYLHSLTTLEDGLVSLTPGRCGKVRGRADDGDMELLRVEFEGGQTWNMNPADISKSKPKVRFSSQHQPYFVD